MFVELHVIQNFAPSNLNRDDTGSPKDCEFGGHRRARISSQCIKRAVRRYFTENGLMSGNRAIRTKRLVDHLTDLIVKDGHKDAGEARAVAEKVIMTAGFGITAEGKTEYLLFVPESLLEKAKGIALANWDAFLGASLPEAKGEKKEKKKGKAAGLSKELEGSLQVIFNQAKAADIALFGRMLADRPEANIDAACQVAHAISTNKTTIEFDYYTAVDDLKPEDTAGADMIGTVEFNSSCFYRYANIDLDQLKKNLGEDDTLTKEAVENFVRAFIHAVPTGKQNSMAAQNPPSMVLAVVRETGLWSLANAFANPVRSKGDKSLLQNSMEALDEYWGRLAKVYGDGSIKETAIVLVEEADLKNLKAAEVDSIEALVKKTVSKTRL